jgi:hypothetical protein
MVAKPIILTTWEVEIRRIAVQSQAGQNIGEIPISTNGWEFWYAPVITSYAGKHK